MFFWFLTRNHPSITGHLLLFWLIRRTILRLFLHSWLEHSLLQMVPYLCTSFLYTIETMIWLNDCVRWSNERLLFCSTRRWRWKSRRMECQFGLYTIEMVDEIFISLPGRNFSSNQRFRSTTNNLKWWSIVDPWSSDATSIVNDEQSFLDSCLFNKFSNIFTKIIPSSVRLLQHCCHHHRDLFVSYPNLSS